MGLVSIDRSERARPRGRGRPRLSLDRRLLDAAGALFYRRGFQAVGVDQISAEAGVTKMTLYKYFSSKDVLAATWLEEVAEADLRRYAVIAQRFPKDPIGQLRAIIRDAADRMASADYRGWSITNIAMELTEGSHPARRVADAYKIKTRAHLRSLAEATGAPRPTELADGLLLLLEGAAASRHTFAGEGPSACLVQAFEGLLMAQHLAASSQDEGVEIQKRQALGRSHV